MTLLDGIVKNEKKPERENFIISCLHGIDKNKLEVKTSKRKYSANTRSYQADLMKNKRRSERNIGELPDTINWERRNFALKCFDNFKRTYFPNKFYRKDCPALERCNQKMETVISAGGWMSEGLPRGTGKTSNMEAGTIYAIFKGLRKFVILVADESDSAGVLLTNLKYVLENNILLLEDFPEICYPIIKLEGIAHRAKGQLYHGERTRINWSTKYIQLPRIEGSNASEAIIYPCSIEKIRRGLHFELDDGRVMRPDLVLIDDPQNDESAKSRQQVQKRETIITGTISGLAGQDKEIAMLMTCTVIVENDLAYRFLSRDIHPEWQGEKHSMIIAWPDGEAMKLWEVYRGLYLDELATQAERGQDALRHPQATAYYLENKKIMDSGCLVMDVNLWEEKHEASAIQHAMNLYFKSPETFMSEYQNEPKKKNTALHVLTIPAIRNSINGLNRGEFPDNVVYRCAVLDLNYYAVSWCVAGFRNDFTPNIADYGFFPGDNVPIYDSKDIETDETSAFIRALNRLMPMMAQKFPALDAVGIDGNRFAEPVYKWMTLNRGKYPWKIYAMRGQGSQQYKIPATTTKQQKLVGRPGVRCFKRIGRDSMPEIWFDSHHWHLFMQRMWLIGVGEPRSISLFGKNGGMHRTFCEQICAERLVDLREDGGKLIYEWKTDGNNEMSDLVTMLNVMANIDGLSPDGIDLPKKKIVKVKYSEKYKDKFKQ